MLLKYFLVVATTFCFLLFMLGVYRITKEIEPNLCQMTYMFKNPQYTKIPLKRNNYYGLYYYNEGNERRDLKALNGAPVLFVPGNGGSKKQVRSLGSVALRMGMGYNRPHLDYFTIDYREELNAVYGGYLKQQQNFLMQCINTILRLYRTHDKSLKRKLVIVGHSMGGIVAKSLLNEADWLKKIAVIIFIATPLDRPVIYADKEIDNFYQQINRLLQQQQQHDEVNADEETSSTSSTPPQQQSSLGFAKNFTNLADVLLISIGGGIRDNLVVAPLTASRLNDLHVITTAMPHVWLSCDHLAAVWCLQFMKVTNKFLYDITFKVAEGFTYFSTNPLLNLQAARHYFKGLHSDAMSNTYANNGGSGDATTFISNNSTLALKSLSYHKIFEHGLQADYELPLRYEDVAPYEFIYIAVTHELAEEQPWLYGCQHSICMENQMLTQQIQQLPSSRGRKTYALLNLAAIFGTFSSWTQLLIVLPTSRHYAALYIDVHNVEEISFALKAPHWFQWQAQNLNISRSRPMPTQPLYRKLKINDITTAFYAFRLKLECVNVDAKHGRNFETLVKIYAPWAAGFERFYVLNPTQNGEAFLTDLLIQLPLSNGQQQSALFVDLHTDPWCDLSLSYRYSLKDSMRNLVQQFYATLPAHLVLIVIANLAQQFQVAVKQKPQKGNFADLLQWRSWHFLIGLRLATKILAALQIWLKQTQIFANPASATSVPSLIVHGFAMACIVIIAIGLRMQISLLRLLVDIIKLPALTGKKWQIIFAAFAAAISLGCAKAISLAFMLLVYTILLAMATSKPKSAVKENPTVVERLLPEHQQNSTENGLAQLSFHLPLLLLILLLIGVNFGDTIAWYKSVFDGNSYHSIQKLSTLLLSPSSVVIFCLPLLWYFAAPTKLESSKYYALVLNVTAACALLFCEEKFYRLNYVIAFVFALLVFREILNKFK